MPHVLSCNAIPTPQSKCPQLTRDRRTEAGAAGLGMHPPRAKWRTESQGFRPARSAQRPRPAARSKSGQRRYICATRLTLFGAELDIALGTLHEALREQLHGCSRLPVARPSLTQPTCLLGLTRPALRPNNASEVALQARELFGPWAVLRRSASAATRAVHATARAGRLAAAASADQSRG
jgi:hypothetical protein